MFLWNWLFSVFPEGNLKRRSLREMRKMINVKVGGMLGVEKEEKKCSLLAEARNKEKKKNMTCNTIGGRNTHFATSIATDFTSAAEFSTMTARTKGRIISNPTRMKFLNSLSPQLNHFETYTSHSAVISSIRRRIASSSFFSTITLSSSSSAGAPPYPLLLTRSLVISVPILIPLLLFIVTMPGR